VNLLGYNYPQAPQFGGGLFVVFCVVFGAVLSWLRLRSGSVWPPALAHAALNALAGSHVLFARAGHTMDNRWAGITGVCGIGLTAVVVVALALAGAFRAPAAASGAHAKHD
jgi:hypothetical protein